MQAGARVSRQAKNRQKETGRMAVRQETSRQQQAPGRQAAKQAGRKAVTQEISREHAEVMRPLKYTSELALVPSTCAERMRWAR